MPTTRELPPLVIRCLYCGTEITLNEDSNETRVTGQDPRQQIRFHIFTHHNSADIVKHHYATGWILDLLFFRCPSDPKRWRANIDATLDHFLNEGP